MLISMLEDWVDEMRSDLNLSLVVQRKNDKFVVLLGHGLIVIYTVWPSHLDAILVKLSISHIQLRLLPVA